MEILKLFFMGLLWFGVNAIVLEDDKRALLNFINNLPHSRSLNWKSNSTTVCSQWTGVTCSEDGSRVIALRLPGVGFHGRIPANTISRLSALKILSLRSNGISGPFPVDFYNLKNLSLLYLQFNQLSGPLPVNFSAWKNLTIVNLSNNKFNGSIPISITKLTHLSALNLANNSLMGQIPDLGMHVLQVLDLSHNHLTGVIPKSLQKFPKSVFVGNNVSMMHPSHQVPIFMPTHKPNPNPKNGGGKLSLMVLLGVIVAVSILGFIVFAIFYILCCFKRGDGYGISSKLEKSGISPETEISRTQDVNNRLVFFEGCNYAFDLEDLLRASAEVLGKGTFGMSYKAILEDGSSVAVKRLKDLSVGKRDFEQQMGIVGSIKHENVIELRAYYHSKDEKLTVCEYYSQGSVGDMLHGKRGVDRVPLTWESRLRIAIGAARGIAQVHTEPGKLVHGNIKSSNIFLNSQNYGCVSDIGLSTIMSQIPPPIARAAGYRAPEITDTRKATQPSDVYSFGVLLLELLTGKTPVHTSGDEIVHLVWWVHSVVREEWTGEVFDVELLKYPNIEEEMVEMLQIAMSCVARVPDQRPKMTEVVKMVEDVRRNPEPENRVCLLESTTPRTP